jgi:hypothetical protein
MFLPIQAKLHYKGLSAKAGVSIVSNSGDPGWGSTYKLNSITGSTLYTLSTVYQYLAMKLEKMA